MAGASWRRGSAPALLALALAAGCAHYTKGIRPTDVVSIGDAYLYGHFFVESKETLLGMDGYQTMGLVLTCADKETYTIRFSNKRGVQAIKVAPSRCMLTEVVYTDADGSIKRRVRPPRSWMRPQAFWGGHAYYVGDYSAVAKFESHWKVVYTEVNWSWDMDPDPDKYDETTDEMKRTFVSLATLPTENRRLAPPERVVPPGAVLRPGEAPLSPDRTRSMAPFIKRTFTNPATCQAACSTGACLPFRGEDGTAMTCVIRCAADKDCPTGLACNCPSGKEPDCRPVASTPSDPMEGFCLSTEASGPRR